jgi:hypothetical protein
MLPAMLHISKCTWFDVVRRCGMEINVESSEVVRVSRQLYPVQIMFYQNNWTVWNILIMCTA